MKQFNIIAALTLTVGLVGCNFAPDLDMDISAMSRSTLYGDMVQIDVTSRMDQVKLTDIRVNRGNCELSPGNLDHIKRQVIDLKFGDTYEIYTYDCTLGQIQELTLVTADGEYSWQLR